MGVITARLIKDGSQNFPYANAAIIAAGVTEWIDIKTIFPQARLYIPLDFFEVINNSAQNITISIGSPRETRIIPAYMIKPFRQPFRILGVTNSGLANIAIGEILINMRRLPPDIQMVESATER